MLGLDTPLDGVLALMMDVDTEVIVWCVAPLHLIRGHSGDLLVAFLCCCL